MPKQVLAGPDAWVLCSQLGGEGAVGWRGPGRLGPPLPLWAAQPGVLVNGAVMCSHDPLCKS